MNEIHTLIDSIRAQEKILGDIAGQRSKAAQALDKASRAIQEQLASIERLTITEKSLSEAGSRYSGLAQKAIRRGLTAPELDQALNPLCSKAMIQAATGMTIQAKDSESKTLIELQRIESQAREELKAIEEDFLQAETKLEELRDQLRILQAVPA